MSKYPKLRKVDGIIIITILATIGFPKDDTVCMCKSCEAEFSGICGYKRCRKNICPNNANASKNQWEYRKVEVEIYIDENGVSSSLDHRLKGFYSDESSCFARQVGGEIVGQFTKELHKLGEIEYTYFFEWATVMVFADYCLFQYNGAAILLSRDLNTYRKMKIINMHRTPDWTSEMSFFPSKRIKSANKKADH